MCYTVSGIITPIGVMQGQQNIKKKNNQFRLYRAKVTVCPEINTNTHKYGKGRMHNFLMLNLFVHHVTSRLEKVNFSREENQYSY